MWIRPAVEEERMTRMRSTTVQEERSLLKREFMELIDDLSDDTVERILKIAKAVVRMHEEKRVL